MHVRQHPVYVNMRYVYRFQSYLTLDRSERLTKLSSNFDLSVACLAPCSGITAFHAVEKCEEAIRTAIQIKGNFRS